MSQYIPKTRLAQFVKGIANLLLALMALLLILLLAVPIGFYAMAMYLAPTLPSTHEIKAAGFEMPLQIYSNDNQLIGQYGNRMSQPVQYEQIPRQLIDAFLAAEDTSFFEHGGISVKGLGRAITEVVTDDDEQTGGSTITMQVAKNYFLSPERTLNRKLTELFLARKIEQELDKNEILTLYVNKIYLGEGAYGIKAAAKKYYSKSLHNLTLPEMAMLAGLPKAPSKYNPVANPQRALERRNWILGRMLHEGYINQSDYDTAVAAPIGLKRYRVQLDVNMPYLAEMTRYALVSHYGSQVINSGWRVRLTVDSQAQINAENAMQKGLINYDRRHGWRGVEAHDQPLAEFRRFANMYPAKVTQVHARSIVAELADGTSITLPWSSMTWARKYRSANRTGGTPSNAAQLVKVDDIIRVSPNADKTAWQLVQIPAVQGSLVSLDPDTGAVLALVGGFDYNYSKFNRATDGWRQPGSTIKPLIYSAALEKGYHADSMISDSPLKVGSWEPKNSDGRYYDDMTLRRGLYLSRNLVSIRLLRSVGMTETHALLSQFGLESDKLPTTLSLALGAGQATPLQMATAYATFANGGHRIQPYFIEQIYNYDNQLLFQANPQRACAKCFNAQLNTLNAASKQPANTDQKAQVQKDNDQSTEYDAAPDSDRLQLKTPQYQRATQAPRILSPYSSYEMADILRDVIQRGTGIRARSMGRSDIGGKTGTTNDNKDAWFAGFHPTNTTVVWLGFDNPSSLGRHEYGSTAALPVWMDFMGSQLKNTPVQWVSLSNQAKSNKPQRKVIEITNDGQTIIKQTTDDEERHDGDNEQSDANATTNNEINDVERIPQAKPQQHTPKKQPAAIPAQLPDGKPNQINNNNNSSSSNPTKSNDKIKQNTNTRSGSSLGNPLTTTPTDTMPPLD